MCCGTGGATCAILRRTGVESQIFGMDLSSGQLKVAARRQELHNVQLIEGDVANTNFPDSYFDKCLLLMPCMK